MAAESLVDLQQQLNAATEETRPGIQAKIDALSLEPGQPLKLRMITEKQTVEQWLTEMIRNLGINGTTFLSLPQIQKILNSTHLEPTHLEEASKHIEKLKEFDGQINTSLKQMKASPDVQLLLNEIAELQLHAVIHSAQKASGINDLSLVFVKAMQQKLKTVNTLLHSEQKQRKYLNMGNSSKFPNMYGGNMNVWEAKYLKYKQKYLNLKNNF